MNPQQDLSDILRRQNELTNILVKQQVLSTLPQGSISHFDEETVQLVKELTSFCLKGGFHLTKWISNSQTVLAHSPKEDRAREVHELDLNRDKRLIERGLIWGAENNMLQFNSIVKERPHTRRNILSIVSSINDPLGFLSPITLPAKMMLQELCRTKHDWDSRIPQPAAESGKDVSRT